MVILTEAPRLAASGDFFTVRVYNSARSKPNSTTQGSPTGATGVGSGILNFKVDGARQPLAYLFAPPLTAQYSYRTIAGRAV